MKCPVCAGAMTESSAPFNWHHATQTVVRNEDFVKLRGQQARIFDMLAKAYPAEIETVGIFERLYAGARDGGPITGPNIVSVFLSQMRKRLKPLGLTVGCHARGSRDGIAIRVLP